MTVGCHQWVAGSTGKNMEGVLWQGEREDVCVSQEREQRRRLRVKKEATVLLREISEGRSWGGAGKKWPRHWGRY